MQISRNFHLKEKLKLLVKIVGKKPHSDKLAYSMKSKLPGSRVCFHLCASSVSTHTIFSSPSAGQWSHKRQREEKKKVDDQQLTTSQQTWKSVAKSEQWKSAGRGVATKEGTASGRRFFVLLFKLFPFSKINFINIGEGEREREFISVSMLNDAGHRKFSK